MPRSVGGTASRTDMTSYRVAAGETRAGSHIAPALFGYVYERAKYKLVSTGQDGG